jgi:CRISPR system Cascade subunit CasD
MHTLFLRLEGPLQSWGLRARWGERDTASEPTKSGVIGLLGCCLGLRRDSSELQHLSQALRMGVRVDSPGVLLRDYHTTGGGTFGGRRHDGKALFHDNNYVGGVLSAEVNPKGRIYVKVNEATKLPETDVSNRYYLADASFLVALQGPAVLLERCEQAIADPVWPYFLGRKSCVPSVPILAGSGDYPDLQTALEQQPIPQRWAEQIRGPIRLLIEVELGQGNHQNDAIGNAARRVFHPRAVREYFWQVPNLQPSINTLEG